MTLTLLIGMSLSQLSNVTSYHWFPDVGELEIYCKEGSWHGAAVPVRAIHCIAHEVQHGNS